MTGEKFDRKNIMFTSHPTIPLMPQKTNVFLGEFVNIAKEKLTKNAEIN